MPAQPNETQHLQPRVMELLRALHTAVGSQLILRDSHTARNLQKPLRMLDCCLLVEDEISWIQLAAPLEMKLVDMQRLAGQLLDRAQHTLASQQGRQYVYGIAVTKKAVQVFRFTRSTMGAMVIERTGEKKLFISSASPGLCLLSRMLQASVRELGYVTRTLQGSFQLGSMRFGNATLLAAGTAPLRRNVVYGVTVQPNGRQAVLKLSSDDSEVRV